MKTATLPPLRVDPALRDAAERVLQEGETLSGLMESALRSQIAVRSQQDAFIARGLASRDSARARNAYVSADEVLALLTADLAAAKKGAARRR